MTVDDLPSLVDKLSVKNLVRKTTIPLDTDFAKVSGVVLAFDFAGGAGTQFDHLTPLLTPTSSTPADSRVRSTLVLPYILPGRSVRYSEALVSSQSLVVTEVFDQIVRPLLAARPANPVHLVLLGYSAGASVAAEVAHRAMVVFGPKSDEMRRLRGIVLIAESGPSHFVTPKEPSPATWSRERMARYVEDTGVFEIADELKADKAFYDTILDRLAADMALEHQYGVPWQTRPPLPSHVSMAVFAGSKDSNVSKEGMRAWAEIASGRVRITWYEAGHHLESVSKFYPDLADAIHSFVSSSPADDPDESEYEYYSTTDDEH